MSIDLTLKFDRISKEQAQVSAYGLRNAWCTCKTSTQEYPSACRNLWTQWK